MIIMSQEHRPSSSLQLKSQLSTIDNIICAKSRTKRSPLAIMSSAYIRTRTRRRNKKQTETALIVINMMLLPFLASLAGLIGPSFWLLLCPQPTMAVSVQRLTVPDLVVVDQPGGGASGNQLQLARSNIDLLSGSQQQQQNKPQSILSPLLSPSSSSSSSNLTHAQQEQPEAASLINTQDLSSSTLINGGSGSNNMINQHELTFECLISYDRKKDKNLIIKWHHDDRVEPIYQWIVELDKISIAPQYKPYILANNNTSTHRLLPQQIQIQQQQQQYQQESLQQQQQHQLSSRANVGNSTVNSHQSNQVQLLEASFRLIRPSKELGGKYTCSAISIQNDDSKWRKMIVFTPPRSFRFNATRTDFGQQLPTIPRVKQTSPTPLLPPLQPTATNTNNQPSSPGFQADNQHQQSITGTDQLPLVYRSRGFDNQPASTISPQMYKTIDYVNVNPNYRPPTASSSLSSLRSTIQPMDATSQTANIRQQQQRRLMAANGVFNGGVSGGSNRYSGVKLICDIDQIFPVPEVSIYRLAIGQNGTSHPMDKLTKSETRIEKNPLNGLYHIQVISVLLDDEIELKYGPNEQVYFECLIGLTNLELSKYSDNKRSLVYRRSPLTASTGSSSLGIQNDLTMADDNGAFNSESSSSSSSTSLLLRSSTSGLNIFNAVYVLLITMNSLFLHHHIG